MTGSNWLCLTVEEYNSEAPSEVLDYYLQPEGTTWAQLNDNVLSRKYKMQRGPYTVQDLDVMFINLNLDFTAPMALAITGLQTAVPFAFVLTEEQVRSYMSQQWYIGTLSQVVDYSNQVSTGEGYTAGTQKWADAVENASNPGQWAILKHPSYEDSVMTLIQGELPAGWLPDPEV